MACTIRRLDFIASKCLNPTNIYNLSELYNIFNELKSNKAIKATLNNNLPNLSTNGLIYTRSVMHIFFALLVARFIVISIFIMNSPCGVVLVMRHAYFRFATMGFFISTNDSLYQPMIDFPIQCRLKLTIFILQRICS